MIRIDTQVLRQIVSVLEDLSGRMRSASSDVLDATQSAPTIEGQFGPAVRALGMDVFSTFEDRVRRLSQMATELVGIADRFDAADQAALPEVQAAFLQWLDGVGLSSSALAAMGMPSGLASLSLQGPGPPPGEGEDEKSWLEYLLDQFDFELAWEAITDKWIAGWLSRARGLPRFTVALPWIREFAPTLPPDVIRMRSTLGLTDEFAGPLLRQVDSNYLVRGVGRLIGDASVPPLFLIGWGLTIAPEQIENISTHAPWDERVADGVVDSGNFLVGEAVGWVVGLASFPQTGPGAVGAKLALDVGAGFAYDVVADNFNWREKLTAEIGEISDEALRTIAERTQQLTSQIGEMRAEALRSLADQTRHMLEQEAYRIPTPGSSYTAPAISTPMPEMDHTRPSAIATPEISPNPTPPQATPSPKPTSTPSPPAINRE